MKRLSGCFSLSTEQVARVLFTSPEISPHMVLIIILPNVVILIFTCTHYCSSGLQSNPVSMKLLVALNALQELMLQDHYFWDYKNHNAGYCLSHELRLEAFVPTSLPWVFFSLVVGHLDLIGNQSRSYMCVGSIPIWSTEIFSTQLPASMVEKSSFSCVHQAQNSPSSHLF